MVAVLLYFTVGRVSQGEGAGIAGPTADQQKALLAQADQVAKKYGRGPVAQANVVATTRSAISELAGYDLGLNPALNSAEPVFVVEMQGDFADIDAAMPAPAPAPRGSAIVFVDRASDLSLLDWYVLDNPLPISKLTGAKTTLDLAQASP